MRLIDVDALMTWFNDHYDHEEFSVGYIAGIINEQPTIEPQRMRGHWNKCGADTRGYSDTYECSVCECLVQYAYCTSDIDYEYCPMCGSYNGGGQDDKDKND